MSTPRRHTAPVRALVYAGVRRWGRHRFTVALTATAFLLGVAVLMLALARVLAEPAVVALAEATGRSLDISLLQWRLGVLLALVLLGLVVAAVLRRSVLLPMRDFRARLRQRVKRYNPRRIATMAYWFKRRTEELKTALAQNQTQQRRLDEMEASLRRRKTALESLVSMSGEALVLVDQGGLITDLSPVACEMSGQPRLAVIGKPFAAVFPCYDDSRERPREHPLPTLVERVLASASTLPRLENVLMVNHYDQELRVLLTASAVLGEGDVAVGALFRLELLGNAGVLALGSGQIRTTTSNDAVSGLMSRESFDRRLEELIALAQAKRGSHVLLLVHHETLYTVSDRFGFAASEQVVWRSAQVMRDAIGDAGECYTLSVDRSAILLPRCTVERASALAENVRKHIAAREFVWADHRFTCTASIALVEIGFGIEGRQSVLDAADQLLLQARRAGGNQVNCLQPDAAHVAERLSDVQWVDWLKARIHTGRAHLISQVIQPLSGTPGQRPHVELYFRMEDDDGVWVSPGAFLPALERHNQTSLVDLWVVRALLDAVGDRLPLLETHELFCINLCTGSLNERDFVPKLCELLGHSAVPAERLCFEIEERTAASHAHEVQRFVNELRPLGVKIALDQCRSALGLELLRDVAIDYVKIHEGLIKQAGQSPIDAARLAWVVRSAQLLSRKVVACGVEDPERLTTLRELGVDYAQGVAINTFGPIMT